MCDLLRDIAVLQGRLDDAGTGDYSHYLAPILAAIRRTATCRCAGGRDNRSGGGSDPQGSVASEGARRGDMLPRRQAFRTHRHARRRRKKRPKSPMLISPTRPSSTPTGAATSTRRSRTPGFGPRRRLPERGSSNTSILCLTDMKTAGGNGSRTNKTITAPMWLTRSTNISRKLQTTGSGFGNRSMTLTLQMPQSIEGPLLLSRSPTCPRAEGRRGVPLGVDKILFGLQAPDRQ
jgi:hypothetical protein